MDNYKEYHENRMKNNNGTTSLETFALIFSSFFEVFISTILTTLILNQIQFAQKYKYSIQFISDFTLIVIPIVLGITVFSNITARFILTLLIITILLLLVLYMNRTKRFDQSKSKSKSTNIRYFVTNARSTISLISIVAILAVDFEIFPRRYAKTEQYGYSLMDVGVGLFVYANGVVAPEIRYKLNSNFFLRSCVQSIPLLVLGFARFALTSELNYHVHVSEYGVHWNFFLTLAMTKIFSSFILTFMNVKHSLTISLILFFGHETLLEMGLKDWVFSHESRMDSFLLANREGIVSSVGYVALYFLSVHFGRLIFETKSDRKLALILFISSLTLLSSVYLLELFFGISRRLANTGYCLWVLFIGVFMTFLFLLAEHISSFLYDRVNFKQKIFVPFIYESISYNGLAYFLLANLLTGLINISFQTLLIKPLFSFVLIVSYMFVNCGVICILYIYKIKLKL